MANVAILIHEISAIWQQDLIALQQDLDRFILSLSLV